MLILVVLCGEVTSYLRPFDDDSVQLVVTHPEEAGRYPVILFFGGMLGYASLNLYKPGSRGVLL